MWDRGNLAENICYQVFHTVTMGLLTTVNPVETSSIHNVWESFPQTLRATKVNFCGIVDLLTVRPWWTICRVINVVSRLCTSASDFPRKLCRMMRNMYSSIKMKYHKNSFVDLTKFYETSHRVMPQWHFTIVEMGAGSGAGWWLSDFNPTQRQINTHGIKHS